MTVQASSHAMEARMGSSQRIGVAEHLAKFVQSPEASPKTQSSFRMTRRSRVDGWQKMITSSAYREMLEEACRVVSR